MGKQKRKLLLDQQGTNKKLSNVGIKCHDYFDWLHPKTFSIKNRYYDRKVRESLEIDMAVVKYGQSKVLNRDNGNFVETIAWKPLFRKKKTLH